MAAEGEGRAVAGVRFPVARVLETLSAYVTNVEPPQEHRRGNPQATDGRSVSKPSCQTHAVNYSRRTLLALALISALTSRHAHAQSPPPASDRAENIASTDGDDRDQDAVLDSVDQCPDRPETYNGFSDDDGCPDVVPDLGHLQGVISARIPLVGRQLQVVRDAAQILDMVAAVLRDHPGITQLTIEAHTDARGADAWNLRLSQARAEFVLRELVQRGIAPTRLVAIGYGEQCPRVPGVGPAVWDRNRRIAFVVTQSRDTRFRMQPTGCASSARPAATTE